MTAPLGPRLRRHRTSVSVVAALGWLVTGPSIMLVSFVVVRATRSLELLSVVLIVVVGVVITTVLAAYLGWSTSAYLDVHERGVVVGRSVSAGAPRRMRFTEIHPGTLRVHSGIGSLQPTMSQRFSRFSRAHLFLAPGAKRGVTFLGPDRDSELSHGTRPPAPGRGIVVFASREAEEIADELRGGLERAGCPPGAAREYLRHGVRELPGNGFHAQQQIPGMEYR